MRFTGFLICLALLALSINGQTGGTVSGYIGRLVPGNMERRIPLADVTVTLTSTSNERQQFTSTTDANGKYKFENIPPGLYVIALRSPIQELQKPSKTISIVPGSQDIEDFALSNIPGPACSPCIRETVTIAGYDSQPVEQVSKTVDVIDGQEMRDRADITLVDSLRAIPGFRVQQLGGFGRTANIKTRGLRNQDTAILIDGIRFRDAAAINGDASPFLSDFTLTSVSRVEILRGPGSSLYGTNAIGGTIDFQTPMAPMNWHGQASAAGGGLGFSRIRGNVSYASGQGGFGFTSGISATRFSKGIDGNDDARNINWQARVDSEPWSNTHISGRIFLSDAFVRLNTDPDAFGSLPPTNATMIDAIPGVNFTPDVDDADRTQDSDFFNGQFVINHAFNSKFDVEAYYSGLSTNRENINGPSGVGFQSVGTTLLDGQIHTANARFRWTPNGVHTVSFGYEFEKEKFGNEGITPDGSGDFLARAGQLSNTLYAQDLISLNDGRLQFSGGLRAQFFSLDEPRFSKQNAPYRDLVLESPPSAITFDGSASYYFRSSGTKLRTHIGSGYRVPSLYERFGSFFNSFGPPPFIAIGDPYLEPEKTWAFDVGVDQDLADKRVRLSAVYFYSKLRQIIGFGNVVPDIGETDRPFGGYTNFEGGNAKGMELSGRFEPTKTTDLYASYTFTDSTQLEPQVFGSGVLTTLGIPKNQFTLVATQRFGNFWVNFDLLVSSSYLGNIFQSDFPFGSYVYRFEGNRRGDLTGGYTIPIEKGRFNLRIFGTIENLFNNEYYENGFRTIGRTARAGASFSF